MQDLGELPEVGLKLLEKKPLRRKKESAEDHDECGQSGNGLLIWPVA